MSEFTKVDKPWGYELWWAKTDRYVGKLLFLKAGEKLSKQYHKVKDETIFVAEGKIKLLFGEDWIDMKAGDFKRIPPGTIHRWVGVEDAKIFEVSTPEVEDVVRLEDAYGREGTSKP